MTYNFKNVYLQDTYTVVGPYEAKGPLNKYFDNSFKNLYCGEKSFEKAEVKLAQTAITGILKKCFLGPSDVDLVIAGDLLNQITASSYSVNGVGKQFLGVYNACATSVEAMIIGSVFIDSKKINNCLCSVSSHNMSSEKQFRNPTEYGAPKEATATFTATGGATSLLTNKKTTIKIESATIGKVVDYNQKDPLNMGAVMSCAAADTLNTHFKDLKRDPSYYDLITTGDLGIYGKEILKDFMDEEYNIKLVNYNDCGVMLYDLKKQKEVLAGGSGPVCSALVNFSYVIKQMREGKLKKVLLVATGALFSPTFIFQKENILSIAHAISLEVVE